MKTKFGNARINNSGYYQIFSRAEGNYLKLVHRLIYQEHYGEIPENYDIHHIDGDKLNNTPENLVAIEHGKHSASHKLGKPRSFKVKSKISNSLKGMERPVESGIKQSNSTNTTRYYRVCKQKNSSCKQGFTYAYKYYENNKRKSITSVNINKLKEKVLAKGLEWIEFDKEDSDGVGD